MKRTISILIIGMLITCLCFAFNLSGAIADDGNTNFDDVDIQMEKEKPAVDAYEEIIVGLGILLPHEKGFPNFPDNYGGAYYENERLVICLTENNEENRSIYNELVSNPDVIEYKEVQNSYNDLHSLMMKISDSEHASLTSSIAINELENSVDIGIPAYDYDNVTDSISNHVTSKEASELLFHEEEKASKSTSLKGGLRIVTPILSKPNGTMTICGTYNGLNSILTAGHAMKLGYVTRLYTATGTVIGSGIKRQYAHKQYYDYGVVQVTGNFTLTNKIKISSGSTTSITSTQDTFSGLTGTTVKKYGATSGSATGTIVFSNGNVTYNDGTKLYGMAKVNITSGQGKKGDSGGPVYYSHKLYGIYSGDNAPSDNSSSATHYYYSPIYGANGFSPKLGD